MGNLDKTVSKTIRLPLDLVEYIELQDGENFSQQLQGILNDCRNCDADRQKKLAEYRRLIDYYRELYDRLCVDYRRASGIIETVQSYLDCLRDLAYNPLPSVRAEP